MNKKMEETVELKNTKRWGYTDERKNKSTKSMFG